MGFDPRARTVIIAGGGIAGLAAALCLARRGFRATVLERAPKFDPLGAGIQLSPNALSVLYWLGLARQVRDLAHAPRAIRLCSLRTGRQLASVPLTNRSKGGQNLPYLVIHRADLQQMLGSACLEHPDIELRFASTLADCATHRQGVTVLTQEQGRLTELRGIALVGADGVRSTTRCQLLKGEPARDTGKTAWRTLVSAKQELPPGLDLEQVSVYFGSGTHIVTYPLSGGRYVNLVVITNTRKPKNRAQPDDAIPGAILARSAAPFTDLANIAGGWTPWPLYEVPPAFPIAKVPITLIGDAAHAMVPYLAQGAAMGLEDAFVLAAQLARLPDAPTEATQSYAALRVDRVKQVWQAARKTRMIYHTPMPFAFARDLVLKRLPAERLASQFDWIHDWRAQD